MIDTNGYLGFTFAGHHSNEYGLLVVSDGSRYHQNLSSTFNDTVVTVPGKNGGYFFGTQLGMRDFDINCAFDELTTHTRDKIQNWLYPNKVGWLIFDEAPYKKYLVKISQVPSFSYLPFNDYRKTKSNFFEQDVLKGELSISFFSFEEYGIENKDYELPDVIDNETIGQQVIDSGLIPKNFPKTNILLSNDVLNINGNNNEERNFSIYNAGNGIAKADFYFEINSNDFTSSIEFYNYDDAQSYIIQDFRQEFSSTYGNYRIEILGTKQEIWAYGIDSNNQLQEKTNIGGYYNQFYPKIYHIKPTEILVVSQSIDKKGKPETLFYPLTDIVDQYHPSDSNNLVYSFTEFNTTLSDYTMYTKYGSYEINGVITPAVLSSHLEGDLLAVGKESFIYLIYPNKFEVNKNIKKFTPIYENTYI